VKSPNVSAHFFISKIGNIYQVLDPGKYTAWHAGEVSKEAYSNTYAIGVEVHFTPKELYWSGYMWAGLTSLVRAYPGLELVTHRQIARPLGRKIDPSGVTDLQFVNWSKSVNEPHKLARLMANTNLRSVPRFGNNIVQVLPQKLTVVLSNEKVEGDMYNGSNLWYYCNWTGYVHDSLVDIIGEV
jgi:N-acetylmuramoyl-L-alanine amidase